MLSAGANYEYRCYEQFIRLACLILNIWMHISVLIHIRNAKYIYSTSIY